MKRDCKHLYLHWNVTLSHGYEVKGYTLKDASQIYPGKHDAYHLLAIVGCDLVLIEDGGHYKLWVQEDQTYRNEECSKDCNLFVEIVCAKCMLVASVSLTHQSFKDTCYPIRNRKRKAFNQGLSHSDTWQHMHVLYTTNEDYIYLENHFNQNQI